MTIYYLDLETGSDAANGLSFANRVKTLSKLSTSVVAGDTVRVMATPDETLVGTAGWTNNSKVITLPSAVTANISDCELAWTGTTNVTCTADTATFKENTKSMKVVIATAFTTGKVAYFPTGTLDLSGYQQISFWFNTTATIPAGTLSLRLCSDTTGDVTVHTFAIPAVPLTGKWIPMTINLGANMSASIASVALYADLDPATPTIQIDNIIACKAVSSPDSLNLQSLIGKVWNRVWTPSTTYAANDIRKPTQPNRNGYRYKASGAGSSGATEPTWPQEIGASVTDGGLTWVCEGLEDTYYGIQSINGTTVKLDNDTNTLGNAGRGYSGATETVATYKREPFNYPLVSSSSIHNSFTPSGTVTASILLSGGWDRTSMSAQTGETWASGQSCSSYGFNSLGSYNIISNWNLVRCNYAYFNNGSSPYNLVTNCHWNNNNNPGFYVATSSTTINDLRGVVLNNNASNGFASSNTAVYRNILRAITTNGNLSAGIRFLQAFGSRDDCHDVVSKNNSGYGVNSDSTGPGKYVGVVTGSNTSAGINFSPIQGAVYINCLLGDATPYNTVSLNGTSTIAYFQKYQQIADSHLIAMDNGTIVSATDQRNTASGISWKFRPTSIIRNKYWPMSMPVAKLSCTANVQKTFSIWTRRDNTNIVGTLKLAGGQLAGVGVDVTTQCAPAINTWTQYNITFTPTESGVVEITFEVYDGVGTTNSFWIDDGSVV